MIRLRNRFINPDHIALIEHNRVLKVASVHFADGSEIVLEGDEADAVWKYFADAVPDHVEGVREERERSRRFAEQSARTDEKMAAEFGPIGF